MTMGQNNNSYARSLVCRHYGMVTIVAVLMTFLFHTSVNHRFYQMVLGMKEAAKTRKEDVQSKRLELFDHHREELDLRKSSRTHIQQAYQVQATLERLAKNITTERETEYEVRQEEQVLREEALQDGKLAWEYGVNADWEQFMSTAEHKKGLKLAKKANDDTIDADMYRNMSYWEEQEGTKRLEDAQKVLDVVKDFENNNNNNNNNNAKEEGLCAWISWACDIIHGSSNNNNNNLEDPAKKASSLAVAAAAEMDAALQEIEDAHVKADMAKELYDRAAQYNNESIALLEDSKILDDYEKEDEETAEEYLKKYNEEKKEYYEDEDEAEQEDAEIVHDTDLYEEYSHWKDNLTLTARSEHFQANQLHETMIEDRREMQEAELRVWKMIKDARHHVVHASWYALFACIAACCVLILISIRILDSIRRLMDQSSFQDFIRDEPYLQKDLAYVLTHLFIFLLSMGFAGDILSDYVHLNLAGRIEIVLLFALVGTTFQAVALHLIPNIHVLKATSTLNWDSFWTLLVEDVGKRGLAIFLVFVMEVLLCWVNLGERAFLHAHRLNRWGMWILTGLATFLHYVCADDIPDVVGAEGTTLTSADSAGQQSNNSDVDQQQQQRRVEVEIGSVSQSPSREEEQSENPETATLLTNSGISSLSENSSLWFSVNLNSSSANRRDRHAAAAVASPHYYGSLPVGSHTVPGRVGATFISSWRSELERVRILLDILIASWALWVIRRDISIIHRLARMPSTQVWGKFPAWILWISIVSVVVSICRALRSGNGGQTIIQHLKMTEQQQSKDPVGGNSSYRYDNISSSNNNNFSPTTL